MTRDEAAEVMRYLCAANPRVRINEATIGVWFEAALSSIDFETGMTVAKELVRTPDLSGQFPTPAQFNEIKRIVGSRFRKPLDADVEEGPSTVLPKEAQRMFDDMRVLIGRPPKHRSEP